MSTKAQKNIEKQVVEAALALAAEQGWHETTLEEIAKKSKVAKKEFNARFLSKFEVLTALGRMIDAQVIEAMGKPDASLSPRDRLFDILMERFDVLNEYRDGICALLKSFCREPKDALISLPWLGYSMSLMLEHSGIDTGGYRGAAKVVGLSGVYIKTLKTWQKDDSPDLGKTMAALDKNLSRAEKIAGRLGFNNGL